MFLRYFLLIIYSLIKAVISEGGGISCLVIRPGFGLVSEECPERAVGCRIKVDRDSIQWYEYSRLYDRNQLVCVLPGEYAQAAGCHRKKGGSVRCWCGERDGCNDPETSRALYRAFERGGNQAVQLASRWRMMKWHETYSFGKKDEIKENSVEIDDVVTRGVNVKSGRISLISTSTRRPRISTTSTSTTTTTTTTTRRTRPTTPPTLPSTATKRPPIRHRVTGKVHANGGKIHKTPILDKRVTLPPQSEFEPSSRRTTKASLVTMNPNPKTNTPSQYELARRRLSEEIKEEDFRLNLILEDEEREMLLDGEERSEENAKKASLERARADAEKRREEAEKKARLNTAQTQEEGGEEEEEEWEEDYQQYPEPYGFRRKHMLQRRREKERQRVAEEERLARIERQEAEDRERKAREKELEVKMEKKVDDYLDGASPLGFDDPNESPKISAITSILFLLAVYFLQ